MSTRHVKPPTPLFFLPVPRFSCSLIATADASAKHLPEVHFPSLTAPQAFPRPDRRIGTPARAGCDRGRDGFRHPALRTVQAVFPHTALQSAVIRFGTVSLRPRPFSV